jgi:DNA-binding response OmpR family regulator
MVRYRKNGIPGEVKTLSRTARIMVVDDDQVARLLLVKVLDFGGYGTTAVDGGAKALEELAKCPYDLLILDLEMPGMKGMELLEKLLTVYPDLRVIILTAYGTMDSAIQALRYKVDDYLLKPLSPGDILKSVQRVLSQKPIATTASAQEHAAYVPKLMVIQPTKLTRIDFEKGTINDDAHLVNLTRTETKILECLVENQNRVVSHSDLIEVAQGYHLETNEAAKILRPVVCRLKQKLAQIQGGQEWIQNVRGVGYLFELQEEPS